MTKLPYNKLVIGQQVTCKLPEEAYYSGYGGRPKCWFLPGMIGTVGSVKTPYVRSNPEGANPRGDYFACVDFTTENGTEWRCALSYYNIVILGKEQ